MSSERHPTVLVSELPSYRQDELLGVLRDHSLSVTVEDAHGLERFLENDLPRAILVGPGEELLETVAGIVRASSALSMVPIIWAREQVDALSFEKAYATGADDVADVAVPEDVARRLLSVPEVPEVHEDASRGTVLVVDTDDRRRRLLGRTLHNADFEVVFAVGLEDILEQAKVMELTAVLTSASYGDQALLEWIAKVRSAGIEAPWVISTPPKELKDLSAKLEDHQPAVVYDGYAPVENVLFVLNDTLSGFRAENRSSPRLLYGTPVSFRVAGLEQDHVGYCYNISDGGLYVRTLMPLGTADAAWLELQPPRSPRRVRLDGKVVWARKHGGSKQAAVPPGFGVAITGGSDVDRKMYSDGYTAFARDLANVRMSIHPPSVKDPSVLPIR